MFLEAVEFWRTRFVICIHVPFGISRGKCLVIKGTGFLSFFGSLMRWEYDFELIHSFSVLRYSISFHDSTCFNSRLAVIPTMYLLTILALVLPCLAYPLTIRQLSGTVENDVINGVCKAVTVIFARGTVEIGNAGIIAGPPFFMALSNAIGANNLAVQGIDYPADFIGFFEGGDNGGSATMASLAAQAVAQCPQTQIVLSGYRFVIRLVMWLRVTDFHSIVKERNWFIKQQVNFLALQSRLSRQQSSLVILITGNL